MDNEAKSLVGLLDNRIAELEEENAMLRERCETAGYMIEMARLAMFGVSGDGTNALAPRVIMEWALGQIEATPGAENYYSVAFEHLAAPDISVVVCIQRRDKETPAGRAARLQAELAQARVDAQVLVGLAAAEYTNRLRWRDEFGLSVTEMDAMYAAADHAEAIPDAEVAAVIHRALATEANRLTAELKPLKEMDAMYAAADHAEAIPDAEVAAVIHIGTRVVVTAALAPDVRTGVVVRLSRHGVSVRHDNHQEGAYLNWTFDEVSVVTKGV